MCGRFTQIMSWAELHRLYSLTNDAFKGRNDMVPRYNISPTQSVPIVHNDADGNEVSAYSNETGQEFRSLTGRLFQRYTGRGSEAKPDGRNVSGSWFINVGVYRLGQA